MQLEVVKFSINCLTNNYNINMIIILKYLKCFEILGLTTCHFEVLKLQVEVF